jgi:hypothetical protein
MTPRSAPYPKPFLPRLTKMQSFQLLSLSLSLLLTPLAAFPAPEFTGTGPWEGGFFGRDSGQDYRSGAAYPVPMMADPNAPPVVANPYGYDGPPPGFEFEPEAPPPPPPLEPLDLMNAPKEQLPALLPPPPPPPQDAQGTDNSAATASEPEKQEGGDFDFMGGRWGIAGQGKYIDAARGDHSTKFDRKRPGDEYDDSEKKKERLSEEERKKIEEQEAEEKKKQEMPPVEVMQDPDHPLRYKVNVGGVKSPEQGAPTNFHVFTDEGGKQMSSNDMNPETEKYIMEKMVPKMSGRRKKGWQ